MPQHDFFATKSPQAVLKHGLLTRYTHYFAGRAAHATGGRVAFIDGYSGAGRYGDGSMGSPLLLASSATRAETMRRDVKLAFVEPDRSVRAALESNLSAAGVSFDVLLDRPLEEVIDGLLDRYAERAVLLFVDPFGLALSFDTLLRILDRSRRFGPVDVLLHFSTLTIARMARAALSGHASSANAAQLDRALGPVDWRSSFADLAPRDGAATHAALHVATMFNDVIAARCGVPSISVPVRKRPGHLPAFLLTLFCDDPVGKARWDFADMAGKACVDWLMRCESDDYEGYMSRQIAQPSLFPTRREPDATEIDAVIGARALEYFRSHLVDLLRARRGMRFQDHPAAVFGAQLGTAREKHVRAVVAELVRDGLVRADHGPVRSAMHTWLGSSV